MNTKCTAKVNKLGEMINAILMKVSENKELYKEVYKLRTKYYELCSLIKKDKSVSPKQARFFKARVFEGNWPKASSSKRQASSKKGLDKGIIKDYIGDKHDK